MLLLPGPLPTAHPPPTQAGPSQRPDASGRERSVFTRGLSQKLWLPKTSLPSPGPSVSGRVRSQPQPAAGTGRPLGPGLGRRGQGLLPFLARLFPIDRTSPEPRTSAEHPQPHLWEGSGGFWDTAVRAAALGGELLAGGEGEDHREAWMVRACAGATTGHGDSRAGAMKGPPGGECVRRANNGLSRS